MPYDYQLACGGPLAAVGILSFFAALVEQRRPLIGIFLMIIGCGLIGWAWEISGQELTLHDLPDSLFRILGSWLN
jgi:hypothetical protein